MPRTNLFASLAMGVAIAVLAAGSAANADIIEIQFTGLNLIYDGTDITDDSAGADELTSVVITEGGVPTAGSPIGTDISIDLEIPDVPSISVLGDSVVSATGGSLSLSLPGGDFLDLDLSEVTVTYVDGGFAQFAFGGSIAAIAGQSLPEGLILGAPTSVSFSSTLDSSTDDGVSLLSFTALGSGEIEGAAIPEPGTAVLGVMFGLMTAAVGMRARLG